MTRIYAVLAFPPQPALIYVRVGAGDIGFSDIAEPRRFSWKG